MNIFDRIKWETINTATILFTDGKGYLPHKFDPRDRHYVGASEVTEFWKYNIGPDRWIYDQRPFNICVFAAGVMAFSYQEGKRFSVKFAVKIARKEGWLKGNGWSYLRAVLKVATKYGMLPYEDMPDEIEQTWEEYSKYDVTPDQLQKAASYQSPEYQIIKNEKEADDAMKRGYCLITGGDWWSAMNDPQPPDFLLLQQGRKLFGHMTTIILGADDKGYINPQTFGLDYGNRGKARIKRLVGPGRFTMYILEKLPGRTDIERFAGVYDGLLVRHSETLYRIKDGKKEEVAGSDGERFYTLPENVIMGIPNREGC